MKYPSLLSSSRKPRLCVIAYGRMLELVLPVADEFLGEAQIEIAQTTFGESLDVARQFLESGQVDAFVTAGYPATVLRSALRAPVGTIQVSGFDLLQALLVARQVSPHIGVMMYGNTLPRLDSVTDLLSIELSQFHYLTPAEAERRVAQMKDAGVAVIVGSNMVVDFAEAVGLRGVLAYSMASIRDGFSSALELARVARLESGRYEQLNAVLHNLQEAVLAVNREHRVIAINPPMQRLAPFKSSSPIGLDLDGFGPELNLRDVLAAGVDERGRLMRIGERDWLANRKPIQEYGDIVGATLTLYDPRGIQEADAHLRTQQRRRQTTARHTFASLIGSSPAFAQAVDSARRYARTDLNVLLVGESGSGKELFAQTIHNASPRANRPFIAVNCAAFPENLLETELFGYEEGAFTGARRGGKPGLFEAAHTGTIFLDEVGDMPLSLQTRLLRVLQEREILRVGATAPIPVDLRVIAATHQPLQEMVAEKKFRQDLFYRLNTLRLQLPALRNRREDVPPLARELLGRALQRFGIQADPNLALAHLYPWISRYSWPGNVRELENICERIAVLVLEYGIEAPLDMQQLIDEMPELFAATEKRDAQSIRERVPAALAESGGNRQKAARLLGVSRSTFWRWCNEIAREPSAAERK